MRVVALTGGIASGKSTFAGALRALGAPVIDADQLARDAVARGMPGLRAIVTEFGEELLGPDGELDRKKMGALAFGDPSARARLEAIVHPAVHALFASERNRLAAQGHAVAFYDVPLLYEVGIEGAVDLVIVVWAPRSIQAERMQSRDGFMAAEAAARLAAQMDIDEKATRADVVVVNDGDMAALTSKARSILADLARGLSRRLPSAPPARY